MPGPKENNAVEKEVVVNAVELTAEQAEAMAAAHVRKALAEADKAEMEVGNAIHIKNLTAAQLAQIEREVDERLINQKRGGWALIGIAVLAIASVSAGVYRNVAAGNAARAQSKIG